MFLVSLLSASVPHLAFCTLGVLFTSCYPEANIQRAAVACILWGLRGGSSQFFSLVFSFQWVPAFYLGRSCVAHWGAFSFFLFWPPIVRTLPFRTLQHLEKVCGKELAGTCELGLWLRLPGILISDAVFKSSWKIELISLYSDLSQIHISSTAPPGMQPGLCSLKKGSPLSEIYFICFFFLLHY